ncbi:unnamed protein product [Oikopleura dioica]|uniref:Uncharacterized protein n=1 Tax=Oikopleura dioica TaxID=34765 RepID=E4YGC3_OIKDI|nr:unnamed protein product [Oikopleura dioica]
MALFAPSLSKNIPWEQIAKGDEKTIAQKILEPVQIDERQFKEIHSENMKNETFRQHQEDVEQSKLRWERALRDSTKALREYDVWSTKLECLPLIIQARNDGKQPKGDDKDILEMGGEALEKKVEELRKINPDTSSESDDEFEGGIFKNLLSMRTPMNKDREIGTCGTINCALKLVTAADGINVSEQKWKRLNLQCSMLLQPMSMFWATRTLTKMKEGRWALKDAIDSASENLFYELMNLKAFHDNINSSSKMSWVLRDWNMVRENIVTKIVRLDAAVNRALTEVDETINKKIETAGLDEILGPAASLDALEVPIRENVRANEARGKFSIIYLVREADEMPLVVIFKHDNYTILDTSEEEWTFNTRVDWEGQDKTIGKILEGARTSLNEYSSAQHAVIIAVSGEEFVTLQQTNLNRRYRKWSGKRQRPRENQSEEDCC